MLKNVEVMKQKVPVKVYLHLIQKNQISPNFYLSEAYLKIGKVTCWEENGWVWCEADDWCLFPPLYKSWGFMKEIPQRVWTDFPDCGMPKEFYKSEFFDYEYILDPTHFLTMIGGKWEKYRKNSRKWAKTHSNWSYKDVSDDKDIKALLVSWLEGKKDSMEDAEFAVNYILSDEKKGVFRKFLYDADTNQLKAINVYDENYKFINYRFCIVHPGESFLDEFARYLFYTDPIIQEKGKLVNDGGCLGSKGLERFKDSLNPVSKRKVYSWIKK